MANANLLKESIPGKDQAEERKKWKKVDAVAQKVILTSVFAKVLLKIMSCTT